MSQKLLAIIILMLFASCSQQKHLSSADTQRLVIPGDFPDPSIIKVGNTYWATCSSSEWGPVFWLAKSENLTDWKIEHYVFNERPDWSSSNYWAPELYHDGKKFFLYYTGRKKGGPLCISIATADSIQGPWTDHGPVFCQDAGSIDASRIDNYLIWKEDGNSVGKPTPIWAQELTEEGTAVKGEKFELFRNDAGWEKNLVEGPFITKHGEYFYCFYAAAGCCGVGCDYAVGVARAKSLKDKWEKYSANPVIQGNEVWKCPGHGTLVDDKYFMYHAYSTESSVYVGRQALVSEISWKKDGWPDIIRTALPAKAPKLSFSDDFTDISNTWRWPVEFKPTCKTENGFLLLNGILAQAALSYNYEATTSVLVKDSVSAGLSAFGDVNNAIGISAGKDSIRLWKIQNGQYNVLAHQATPATTLQFKLVAKQGSQVAFFYSTDGKTWIGLGPAVDGTFLPPWDRSVRIALVAQGQGTAYFDWFRLNN